MDILKRKSPIGTETLENPTDSPVTTPHQLCISV